MLKNALFILCTTVCLLGCNSQVKEATELIEAAPKPQILTYAKRFTIKHQNDFTILQLLGNKDNNAITSTFILYKNQKPSYIKDAYYIQIPVKKVASMSSVYTLMLMQLGEEKSIAAIDNVDYYNSEVIQKNVANKKIIELSKGPSIEIEKTLVLKPDLLLTFGMGNPKTDVDKKLVNANIPIAISLDHLEETPLARAEWIKFYASFFDKSALADSLFLATEKKYNALKALTKHKTNKPTVLTEIKYGDTWYVPSGKSYIANLIADAGGNYFWKDDTKSGSTPLSFEIVYTKAKDCDVWINLYNLNSKKELLSFDARYGLFKAAKNGRLYNNNKTQNAKGYSNYWETAIMQPDEVLADLIAILYPEILPNHTFTYYKQLP